MSPAELKAWRAEQGLSQPALAALLGVHEVTLSRWERGERDIPPYLHLALEALATRQRRPTRLPKDPELEARRIVQRRIVAERRRIIQSGVH